MFNATGVVGAELVTGEVSSRLSKSSRTFEDGYDCGDSDDSHEYNTAEGDMNLVIFDITIMVMVYLTYRVVTLLNKVVAGVDGGGVAGWVVRVLMIII